MSSRSTDVAQLPKMMLKLEYPEWLSQCHGCWCPGEAADDLDPCVATPPATTVLNMKDKRDLVFHRKGFPLPVLSQCWEIIENGNMIFKFSIKIISAQKECAPYCGPFSSLLSKKRMVGARIIKDSERSHFLRHPRLLHSLTMVAVGVSLEYEPWHPFGQCCCGWS